MSEDELRRAIEELASLPVEQLLVGTVQTLVNVAFLRLGMVEGMTQATDRDQARLSIDAIAALDGVLASRLPPEAASELHSVLASLRMAYASGPEGLGPDDESGGAPPPPPDEPPPGPDRPAIWTPRGEM